VKDSDAPALAVESGAVRLRKVGELSPLAGRIQMLSAARSAISWKKKRRIQDRVV
jgi:hypothetical protein